MLVISKMRSSLLAVLWAWVGFVVAGVGFQKMIEYEDFVGAARENLVVGLSFEAVVAGAVVALAAVVVRGTPLALVVVRQAFAEGHEDVPLLFCVPLFSGAAFVGYVIVLMRVVYPELGSLAVHDSVNVALFLSVVGAFVLAAGPAQARSRSRLVDARSVPGSTGSPFSPPRQPPLRWVWCWSRRSSG